MGPDVACGVHSSAMQIAADTVTDQKTPDRTPKPLNPRKSVSNPARCRNC